MNNIVVQRRSNTALSILEMSVIACRRGAMDWRGIGLSILVLSFGWAIGEQLGITSQKISALALVCLAAVGALVVKLMVSRRGRIDGKWLRELAVLAVQMGFVLLVTYGAVLAVVWFVESWTGLSLMALLHEPYEWKAMSIISMTVAIWVSVCPSWLIGHVVAQEQRLPLGKSAGWVRGTIEDRGYRFWSVVIWMYFIAVTVSWVPYLCLLVPLYCAHLGKVLYRSTFR